MRSVNNGRNLVLRWLVGCVVFGICAAVGVGSEPITPPDWPDWVQRNGVTLILRDTYENVTEWGARYGRPGEGNEGNYYNGVYASLNHWAALDYADWIQDGQMVYADTVGRPPSDFTEVTGFTWGWGDPPGDPDPSEYSTNGVVWVAPWTNGLWQSTISGGVSRIEILLTQGQASDSVFVDYYGDSVFLEPVDGISWFEKFYDDYYDLAAFEGDRLKVDVGGPLDVNLTGAEVDLNVTIDESFWDYFLAWWESAKTWVQGFWVATFQDEVHGGSVFKDGSGASVFKGADGKSIFDGGTNDMQNAEQFSESMLDTTATNRLAAVGVAEDMAEKIDDMSTAGQSSSSYSQPIIAKALAVMEMDALLLNLPPVESVDLWVWSDVPVFGRYVGGTNDVVSLSLDSQLYVNVRSILCYFGIAAMAAVMGHWLVNMKTGA